LEEAPSQIANLGENKQLNNDALASALEDLFEKSLAEAAAEELGNGEPGNENGDEKPLTQEDAEKIYEELMGNE
jgi:hypothetical protein